MIVTATDINTAAGTNSMTTADAKTHLRVDFADATENTYIDSLIVSAQSQVEAFTNRILISTTFDFYLSAFPVDGIVLPFNPVDSITSIKYFDEDNSEQTWDSANYTVNIYEQPCVIRYINTPPGTYEKNAGAVVVEFVAGYADIASVPDGLKHAVKLLLTDLYENRSDMPREKFTAWKSLAYPYRVFHSTTENR